MYTHTHTEMIHRKGKNLMRGEGAEIERRKDAEGINVRI